MQRILITGANRGIGLELTRQALEGPGARVFAACRSPQRASQLQNLAARHRDSLRLLQLDINDESAINSAAASVRESVSGLDLLFNNAGIYPKEPHKSLSLGQLRGADVAEVVTTNSVGPLLVTQAFRHLLRSGDRPRVIMVSSQMGSLRLAAAGSYGYRMSKAAMNMAARLLSLEGEMRGIITIAAHPGWVSSDMGGPGAPISPAESAAALMQLADGLTSADNGRFVLWDGSELDW